MTIEGRISPVHSPNKLSDSLTDVRTANSSTQNSFTAHQPDVTQISLNSSSDNSETEVGSLICASENLSNIKLITNESESLQPFSRRAFSSRSATPIRLLHDPLRRWYSQSTSAEEQILFQRRLETLESNRRSRSMPPMSSSISYIDDINFEDVYLNNLRLRNSRRPMYDGDSTRNMTGNHSLIDGLNGAGGVRFLVAGRPLGGVFNARRNRAVNRINRNPRAVVVNNVEENNNENSERAENTDRRAIPMPPPPPPLPLYMRPQTSPTMVAGSTAEFSGFRGQAGQSVSRNPINLPGRARQQRRFSLNEWIERRDANPNLERRSSTVALNLPFAFSTDNNNDSNNGNTRDNNNPSMDENNNNNASNNNNRTALTNPSNCILS